MLTLFTPQRSAGAMVVPYSFQSFPKRGGVWILSLPVQFLFVIKFFHLWVLSAKCPCNNGTIFKRWKPGSPQRANQWGEQSVLHALLNQIPLSFGGTGSVDIGLRRLLRLFLLIETSTRFLTRFTSLSEKKSFPKKQNKTKKQKAGRMLTCCYDFQSTLL